MKSFGVGFPLDFGGGILNLTTTKNFIIKIVMWQCYIFFI
jgi:hypothetical protein